MLTRANALTALRLLAAPALFLCLREELARAALALFVLAVVTDVLDGWVARRYGESSAWGGLFDHASDAGFVTAGLAALAFTGKVSPLLPWLIAGAFLQYALDSRALVGQPLRTSWLGRTNGIAYFVLLGIPVVQGGLGLGWPPATLVHFLGWLLVVSTAVSMGDRLRVLWRLSASGPT